MNELVYLVTFLFSQYLTFPFFCLLFGHIIHKVLVFHPNPTDGRVGFVRNFLSPTGSVLLTCFGE